MRTTAGFSSVDSLLAITLAALLLAVATWWRARSRSLAPLPSAFGLAAATPPAMLPVVASGAITFQASRAESVIAPQPWLVESVGSAPLEWFGLIAATIALAPFCWELTRRVPVGTGRRTSRLVIGACLVGSLVVAGLIWNSAPVMQAGTIGPTEFWWVFVTVAVLAASAAAALETTRFAAASRAKALTAVIGYLGMGLTVSAASLALASAWWPSLGVPALAIAATIATLGRFAIKPLEAEIDTAHRERDLVLSALEGERGRVASAIHDGPLADLTLLTLQLDAAGDSQNAALIRSVAGELRALGNELRVPILDDLGAGPAIEWLAGRVSEHAHVNVEVAVLGNRERPPATVEVAMYRIAQEAIFNAAKHGGGPVVVRYDAKSATASLRVTDAGPGISALARELAVREGHLGLVLMARRAEAIGARLQISPALGGGTSVNVEWDSA